MLHDGALAWSRDPSNTDDRRSSPRRPCPAEIVVRWHHEPGGTVRYQVEDHSEGGGMRIRSVMPMLTGMTASLLRLLPEGRRLDQQAMVVWCRPDEGGAGYVLGLRFMDPV